MKIFKNLSNSYIFFTIFLIFFFKILIYFLIKNNFLAISLGGGNDADYYHDYAMGSDLFPAVNFWPIILRYLNSIGLYSREIISYFFLFLNLLIIPILTAKLAGLSFNSNQKYYLYIFLITLIYPSLFFYTFDIYREIFMVLCFLIGCLTFKKYLNSSNFLVSSLFYILAISIGFLLIALRPYLGYSFLIALLLWKLKFTKRRLILFCILYFVFLFVANYIGVFDSLTEYREGFEEDLQGGSNLGLDFSDPIMFIPNFILSLFGQLFGLYLVNPLAILLFIIETIPILFMLNYIVKNIKYADNFIRFLIIFFVIYASVWLIGNDNLGTAVRLRFYNYFAIYIAFFYIVLIKSKALEFNKLSSN